MPGIDTIRDFLSTLESLLEKSSLEETIKLLKDEEGYMRSYSAFSCAVCVPTKMTTLFLAAALRHNSMLLLNEVLMYLKSPGTGQFFRQISYAMMKHKDINRCWKTILVSSKI